MDKLVRLASSLRDARAPSIILKFTFLPSSNLSPFGVFSVSVLMIYGRLSKHRIVRITMKNFYGLAEILALVLLVLSGSGVAIVENLPIP